MTTEDAIKTAINVAKILGEERLPYPDEPTIADDVRAAVAVAELVDDAIADVPLRPSIATVHAEINRRANDLFVRRAVIDEDEAELRQRKASAEKASAELLDLMRDAGIASTKIERYGGKVATVTVVVRHDYDIVDLDAAVAMLTAERGSVPMTEPKVDTAAIKRIAKVTDGPIDGVVPTESAHLRWT